MGSVRSPGPLALADAMHRGLAPHVVSHQLQVLFRGRAALHVACFLAPQVPAPGGPRSPRGAVRAVALVLEGPECWCITPAAAAGRSHLLQADVPAGCAAVTAVPTSLLLPPGGRCHLASVVPFSSAPPVPVSWCFPAVSVRGARLPSFAGKRWDVTLSGVLLSSWSVSAWET